MPMHLTTILINHFIFSKKNRKSNSNHAFITTTIINLYKNIKHIKHAKTCDTTVVSKEMQYHISLHSIAGEE